MTDPNTAQRAREWLEHQLAELAELRNATRRDHNFKAWRQHTLTVIQRVWPGDTHRVERFRRVPFSPPMSHATDKQVREFYERGWGEAGVLLREFLAEVNLLGLSPIEVAGTRPGAETEAAMGPMPALDRGPMPEVESSTTFEREPEPPAPGEPRPDVIGRAMERLFGDSPVFRKLAVPPPPAHAGAALEPDSPAAELLRLAGELEALGLSPAQASPAREALLALSRAPAASAPEWGLVQAALRHAVATPALARRALPLLLGYIDLAA
jgi:hypothetical protein